jgi:putative hydrolase of the HAD superfamily
MIRTVLFDMGNVLVCFSHDRMCAQIGACAGMSGPAVRRLLLDSGLQGQFERGELSETAFQAEWQRASGRRVPLDALVSAASRIFWPNPGMAELVRELKERGTRLVLLSNTCGPHLTAVRQQFGILDAFDALVTSCSVGALKPSDAMYAAALREIQCDPGECFYTDDIPEYVAAGRRHGLLAEVFTDAAALRSKLKALDVV